MQLRQCGLPNIAFWIASCWRVACAASKELQAAVVDDIREAIVLRDFVELLSYAARNDTAFVLAHNLLAVSKYIGI